ncbi:MAG: acyltransferase domain-containing protein [Desulfovibrio sp.]|jgi:malonyl CoA-acyl carrier protein transacylase|nr:acyltransferase domain-containing protein [Desulfovibrio sp.]
MNTPSTQAAHRPSPGIPGEIALDGVRYVAVEGGIAAGKRGTVGECGIVEERGTEEGGGTLRLASLVPDWPSELPRLAMLPDPEEERRLAERGIWTGRGDPPPLAVMCCGLGSAWPGMGRELYDGFPAARDAMDRIAAAADWDVLGLMDEPDPERIGYIRWQQPYTFLVEYAQWSVLVSLGVRPAVVCGHSMGELIALCLGGVYTPEVAWYIMDTRAEHMGELEQVRGSTGMMAVHAGIDVVRSLCGTWPQLRVSNYNTPTQFILSGPRDVLAEARADLRKRRVPALILNVSRAFHHPDMVLLRDLALRRLGALEMHPADIPVLKCCDADYYPDDQPSVCRAIADLDEHAVRWTRCVQFLWERDGVRRFVELGPQDTLCGLVTDNRHDAVCWSAGRKGQEAAQLRRLCAMLHAGGHCDADVLRTAAGRPRRPMAPRFLGPVPEKGGARGDPAGEVFDVVRTVLAEAAGRRPEELGWGDDLRHDLGLRSSRFPLIVQGLETRLGCAIAYESLLGVVTLGDLVGVLTPETDSTSREEPRSPQPPPRPPLRRHCVLPSSPSAATPQPPPFDPAGQGLGIAPSHRILLWIPSDRLLRALVRDLAPHVASLAVPDGMEQGCLPDMLARERLAPMGLPGDPAPSLKDVAARLRTLDGPWDGLVALLPQGGEFDDALPLLEAMNGRGLRYVCLVRLGPGQAEGEGCGPGPERAMAMAAAMDVALLAVSCPGLDPGDVTDMEDAADLLTAELMRGTAGEAAFARIHGDVPFPERTWMPPSRPSPIFPGSRGDFAGRRLSGACHFSDAADPGLAGDRLPLGRALAALAAGAAMRHPWCRTTGFSDLRFGDPPGLVPGVVRECRLEVLEGLWLMQDGVYTRMCRSRLDVEGLTDSGRRTGRFAPVISGMVLAAAGPGHPDAFLPPPDPALDGEGASPLPLAVEGTPACRRLLGGFAQVAQDRWQARLVLPEGAVAAGDGEIGTCACLVEGCTQGARLALGDGDAAKALPWRLATAGFIRFGPDPGPAPHRAILDRTWREPGCVRFNGEVTDGMGRTVVTLHHVEFVLPSGTPEAASAPGE